MIVTELVPEPQSVPMVDVLERLRRPVDEAGGAFSDLRLAFSDDVSRAILRRPDVRAHPELVALAFFLRRSAVTRLARDFAELVGATQLRAPLGLAFHVPPTNVDTVFAYSLLLSLLVGNRNVVRLSPAAGPEARLLVEIIGAVLRRPDYGALLAETAIISYGHEPEPTAAASLVADVRVIWGGDDTVATIRSVPLQPGAREVAFADRFSFAAVDAEAFERASVHERRAAARGLFNDTYPFDQRGCSSPRLAVFVGPPAAARRAAEGLFTDLAAEVSRRGYRLDTGAVLARETFAYGALIDRPVAELRRLGNELTVLRLTSLNGFDRTHPGAGLFFEAAVDDLGSLVEFVTGKDQTLSYFGFSAGELEGFAQALRSRGLDRIVPLGEALAFGRYWDGHDLLADLTRVIALGGG
ncbi:MAG TPA: acyl-CoA reductase [Solirubrobacteraceae bacterium]|nr:acyl-CoA reductase [Solirubrobacteraceae bacterium]